MNEEEETGRTIARLLDRSLNDVTPGTCTVCRQRAELLWNITSRQKKCFMQVLEFQPRADITGFLHMPADCC